MAHNYGDRCASWARPLLLCRDRLPDRSSSVPREGRPYSRSLDNNEDYNFHDEDYNWCDKLFKSHDNDNDDNDNDDGNINDIDDYDNNEYEEDRDNDAWMMMLDIFKSFLWSHNMILIYFKQLNI